MSPRVRIIIGAVVAAVVLTAIMLTVFNPGQEAGRGPVIVTAIWIAVGAVFGLSWYWAFSWIYRVLWPNNH